MSKYIFLLYIAIPFALFSHPSNAMDTVEELKSWIATPPKDRIEFQKTSFAATKLTKTESEQITKLLVSDFEKQLKASRAEEWKSKSIAINNLKMKFELRTFGEKPKNGRRLFISMHGGGGAPPRVNEQQWRNQIGLYQPKEGVYLAPRAPTDTWNLWHQSHIDLFFQRIIEDAILFEDVDPNKIYIMGYSAGGDGVYQLAPRMADSLAAAAMMAGHPNDASPLGLRNIGFTLHMGGKDGAYNRNKVAREWKKKLADLKKADPQGYKHEVTIHEQHGHWMQRDDRVAVPWMAKFSRDPFPKKIVWRQSGVVHSRFYWLAVNDENKKPGSHIVVQRDGQHINITKSEKVSELVIRLNDSICDLEKPITVTVPDGSKKEFKVDRTADIIFKSLNERFDPKVVFTGEIKVKL